MKHNQGNKQIAYQLPAKLSNTIDFSKDSKESIEEDNFENYEEKEKIEIPFIGKRKSKKLL